jgi:type I restriction enzyme R subunit
MPPYTYADAVADGVNVDFDIYKIGTRITSAGSRVESDYWIDKRDRLTRVRCAELLDTGFSYTPEDLNRAVVAPDQIRTVVRGIHDREAVLGFGIVRDAAEIVGGEDAHAAALRSR